MLIGKSVLPEENVIQLIGEIKNKKELRELSDDFVRDNLFKYLQEKPKLALALIKKYNTKSATIKKIVKELRARLRRVYGLFRVEEEAKKRKELFNQLFSLPVHRWKQVLDQILATHSSTKERLPFYQSLYQKLFKITGKPQTLIDLGCGINPFSLGYLKLKNLNYYAYDISEEEQESLNKFFKKMHSQNKDFKGRAEVFDLLHWVKLKKLKQADICLLFKMTDVLDQGKGHKISEIIIRNVPAKYVVVSFPTLTMSGKKMNHPRRKWIELMCQRLKYPYQILEFSNEIFYCLKK